MLSTTTSNTDFHSCIAVNSLAFWCQRDLGLILALPFANSMTFSCAYLLKVEGDKAYKTLSTVSGV